MQGVVNFSFARFQTMLLAMLATYKDALIGLDMGVLYGGDLYQAGGYYIVQGPKDISYEQATIFCTNSKSEFFSVREDTNLNALMAHFGTADSLVWTGIFKSKLTNSLIDNTKLPPVTMTNFENIELPDTTTILMDGVTNAVVLKKEDTGFVYRLAVRTMETGTTTLCMRAIDFPRRKGQITALTFIQSTFLKDLSLLEIKLAADNEFFNRELMRLPFVSQTDLAITEVLSEKQIEYEAKIQEQQLSIDSLKKMFSEISDPIDLVQIYSLHSNVLEQLFQINALAVSIVTRPLLTLRAEWLPLVGSDSELLVKQYPDDKTHFLIDVVQKAKANVETDQTNHLVPHLVVDQPVTPAAAVPLPDTPIVPPQNLATIVAPTSPTQTMPVTCPQNTTDPSLNLTTIQLLKNNLKEWVQTTFFLAYFYYGFSFWDLMLTLVVGFNFLVNIIQILCWCFCPRDNALRPGVRRAFVKIHLMKRPSQSPQLPLVKKKKLRIAIPEIESYADYEDSERSIDPRAISPEFEYVPRDQIPLNRRESLLPPLVL